MRKLLIAIGIVLVLLLGALILVPRLIGTDQLTAFLTERLRTATGYNVSIRGPVALSVLPSPSLSVGDIRVTADAAPAGPELARAGSIEVDVALLPLIGGRVEVTAVTLRDPVVSLDGPLGMVKPVNQAPAQPVAEAPTAAPPPAAGSKFSVAVRHVRVTNGSLSYRDAGKTYTVDHLDLDLTTAADGTISGSADTGFNDDKVHLAGRVGAIDCAKPIPLSLHATAEQGVAKLDFDGLATCEDGRLTRADGKVKLAADSARVALVPFIRGALPPVLDQHVALDGTLGTDGTKADLTDLTLDLDQTHGVGSMTAHAGARPSIDLTLDLNRLDLGTWLDQPTSPGPAVGAPPRTAAAGPPAPEKAAKQVPVLADLHIGLDLSAELLAWHGGLIRQARFNGGIDQGAMTINQATAELPGGTDLSISGQVADAFNQARFTGTVDAETDNLRALVDWTGLRLSGVPLDRLRQASLSTSLDLDANKASATGIDLDLDGSRFKGAANLMFGDRPAIGLRLAGDQLNLDAYLTGGTAVPVVKGPASTPASSVSPVSSGPAASLGSSVPVAAAAALLPLLAANLDLSFDRITWRGQLLKNVHLAGTIDGGAVTVREARIGDLAGGNLAFAGRWSGGLGPAALVSGRVTASGPSAAPLLTFAGLSGQETAGRLGAYGLEVKAEGSPLALEIAASLSAQDGRLATEGQLGLDGGVPHFVGTASLDHPETARLVALAAPLYRPAGGMLGALALSTSIDATPGRVTLDHLALSVGAQRIAGTMALDRTAQPPRLDADLTAGDLTLDPFLPAHEVALADAPVRYAALGDPVPLPGRWSRAKLDFSWLGLLDATVKLTADSTTLGQWRLDKPALAVGLKGGALGLDTLTGGLFGGKLAAHGSLTQAPALTLTLAGQGLDLKDLAQHLGSNVLTAGTGALDADLSAAGTSEADLIGTLGGKATLAARDGAATGFDLGAINEKLAALKGPQDLVGVLQAAQAGGSTRFSTLDATAILTNGVIRSTDLHLVADGGDLTGAVTADLPAWTIDGKAALALAARPDLPPLAMSFDGPLDRPEKRIDVKTLAAYVERQGVGNLLQGLTGQQPATPASPSQQQQKPAQQLRDLFKGLLSKPNP